MPIESDKAFGTEIPGRKTLGDFIGSIDMDFIVIRMCNACQSVLTSQDQWQKPSGGNNYHPLN